MEGGDIGDGELHSALRPLSGPVVDVVPPLLLLSIISPVYRWWDVLKASVITCSCDWQYAVT